MMERQRPHSKVSVEDLLRLKRAERPAPEFWTEFEAQLRYKQLAAIVDKRPWWRRMSWRGLGKISVPLGASAAIALTALTVRQPQPAALPESGETAQLSTPERTQPAAVAQTPVSSLAPRPESSADAADTSPSGAIARVTGLERAHPVAANEGISSAASNDGAALAGSPEYSLAQVILGLEGSTESDARPQFELESSLLAALRVDEFQPASLERREVAEAQPVAAVSQDPRRARLLASLDASDAGDSMESNPRVARSRERITRRLTEQALYDSISRLGVNGDSVTIRF